MLKASKLWMLWPQNSIFQHLLLPEACPEGDIKNTHNVYSKGYRKG